MTELTHARPCKYLWLMPIVAYNGDLTVCCNDVLFEFRLGNLQESSLPDLWEGEKVTHMRLCQIKGAWEQIKTPDGQAKCQQCIQHWDPPAMNDDWILDYLETIGQQDLIPTYLMRVYPREQEIVPFLESIGRSDLAAEYFPAVEATDPPCEVISGKEIETIRISPMQSTKAQWNREKYTYNNEDNFGQGFSFVAGRETGFFEYGFGATLLHPKQITVTARLASLDWQANQPSEVTLFLNGVDLGTQEVVPLQSGYGDVYTWQESGDVEQLQLSGRNRLRLEIRPGAVHKGGLAILDRPLQSNLEHEPVTVVLDSRETPQVLADSNTFPIHVDTVLIELADHCNLNCIMCDQSPEGSKRHGHEDVSKQVHSQEKGFMAIQDVIKVIDDINRGSLRYGMLSLFWLGEPLLHPEFPGIIEYISTHRRNFSGWLIHTNGLMLTENSISLLLQHSCESDILHFSVDAATAGTYANVRRGGDFHQLMRNIEALLADKHALDSNAPRLVFQFIVLPENQHEAGTFIEQFRTLLSRYGQHVTVACRYSQLGKNTLFLREEITTPQKQPEASKRHRETCQALGLECD